MVRTRIAGLNKLTWLGEPVTQYGDVLIYAEDELAALRAAWSHM